MSEKVREKVTYNLCYEDIFQQEDTENRMLYINGEIDENVIDSIVYYILRYNRLDKGKPRNERKPIILYINSPGGNVTEGYGVIDAILQSNTPVYTVNLAECYSMGFLIFIAGEKRFGMPNSTYLCHDGSSMAFDSMSKLKDRMEFEIGQMAEHTKNYVVSRTKISDEQYNDNYRKEWYFYPEEAKELGVVTHIVGTDCNIDEII